MYIKISLSIVGMILGVAATGLVTALTTMSETALAVGTGGGCGVGGCGGDQSDFPGTGGTPGAAAGFGGGTGPNR
jgi:hypothetical protein